MMQSQNYSIWHLRSGEVESASWSEMKHILSKTIVASHELTLSSSCLITADRIENVLIIFSIASYDKIFSDWKIDEEKDMKAWGTSENPGRYMHNRQNALTDMPWKRNLLSLETVFSKNSAGNVL